MLNVTHRKDGNKLDYSDSEKICIKDADIPGLPYDEKEWNEAILGQCVVNAFLKCEVENKDESGIVIAKVSHSGVGGY